MALTELSIKHARPKEKPYKIYDEKGLYLIVTPNGGKWWRLDYMFKGKRKTISLGIYPEVSLKEARLKRDETKAVLARGEDPSNLKKISSKSEGGLNLELIANEWFDNRKRSWTEKHAETVLYRLNRYILPTLGKRPLKEITTPVVYEMLQAIEKTGRVETAHRVKQIIGMIYQYAMTKGLCEYNPAAGIGREMLLPKKPKHYPTILDPKEVGALMRAIDGYEYTLVRCALKFLALTFVRPGELRHAEWKEINVKDAIWEIPAQKMKMKEPHIVPLSKQAISILEEMKPITGLFRYVFPGRDFQRPISENTLNAALRRMGYSTTTDITAHGFRAMARTLLHERLNFPSEVIERQLAHQNQDAYGGAYNRAQFLDKRREMMQVWADYLDSLKAT